MKEWVVVLVSAAACASATAQAQPQNYPTKPIRFIVPFAPGGGVDIVARAIALKLTDIVGQQIIVDNRGGGGTIIGTELGARAVPDGYTLLFGSTTLSINPSLRSKLPYDTLKDLTAVTQASFQPYVLAVHPGVAAKSVKEFIALAKANPKTLTYGSPGLGSGSHLVAEFFGLATGTQMIHVPYKGSSLAVTDLIAGQINFTYGTILAMAPHVRSGKLRGLAVSSAKRSSVMPEVPTIAEAGVPRFDATSWNGVLVPSGVPRPIVDRIHSSVVRALHTPEVRERLTGDGAEPVGSTPEEFAAFIRAEIAKWGKVIKAAGLKVE
ncbi:MAG: tripartite tricarboxylate transporter substrate binding protein [Burkholderiales bacterium]